LLRRWWTPPLRRSALSLGLPPSHRAPENACNRTASSSAGFDDSRTVSRTGIDEETSKEHEQNALPDILVTMSRIPDLNRELGALGEEFAVFDVLQRKRKLLDCTSNPPTSHDKSPEHVKPEGKAFSPGRPQPPLPE